MQEPRKVFECPWWWVEESRYEDSGGEERSWFTARRPNPETVHVLGLTADGRVPLIRQWRVPYDNWVWELPAGLCDVDGEPIAQTAARELEEETGFRAGVTHFLLRGTVTPGLSDEMWNGFLCTELSQVTEELGVHGERIELKLLPFRELQPFLLNAARGGELVDSKIFGHIALAELKLAELGIEV